MDEAHYWDLRPSKDPDLEKGLADPEELIDELVTQASPDTKALVTLATPDLVTLLNDPRLSSDANAPVRAAAFDELVKRAGMAFACRVVKKTLTVDGPDKDEDNAVAATGERISAASPRRSEHKDASGGGGGKGGFHKAAQGTETTSRAKKADASRTAKRRVVEESLGAEQGANANGHVSYWVADESEVQKTDTGYAVVMRTLNLHSKVHVRPASDANFKTISDFAPWFGQAFDTSYAEYTGIVLHEQQHVQELRSAWMSLYPVFQARVSALTAGSPAEVEEQYRAAFDEFDEALFQQYMASGEVNARSLEWAYYHEQYLKQYGRPANATGSVAGAAAAGAAHGQEETVAAQAAADSNS